MVESAATLRKAMSDIHSEEVHFNDDTEIYYNKDFMAKCIYKHYLSFS